MTTAADDLKATFATASVEETLALGAALGAALAPGDAIALVGTLGSGKTHFVKGVAQGAGVPPEVLVTSPTFVLVLEYPGRILLHHIDTYRMRDPRELSALGFDEMTDTGGVVLVEWADRVEKILPDDHLRIAIEITGPTQRGFTFRATGPRSARLLAELTGGECTQKP